VHSARGTVAPWVTSGLRSAPVAKGIEADYLRRVARMGGRVVEGTGLEMRSQLFLGFPSRIAVSVFSRINGSFGR
jgi:hypothetical protein